MLLFLIVVSFCLAFEVRDNFPLSSTTMDVSESLPHLVNLDFPVPGLEGNFTSIPKVLIDGPINCTSCLPYNCSNRSDCTVEYYDSYNISYAVSGPQSYEPYIILNYDDTIHQDPIKSDWNSNPFSLVLQGSKRQVQVTITFNSPVIEVRTPDPTSTFVLYNVGQLTDSQFCGVPCTITLPSAFLIKDGYLNVKVFVSDVLARETTFTIEARDTCQIVQCTFICWEYFTHFMCYSTSAQAIIAATFALAIFSTLCIFIYCLTKFILFVKSMGPVTVQYPATFPAHTVLIFCFLSLLVCCNSQCTSMTTVQSDLSSCITRGDIRSCSVQLNVLTSLISLGSKACGVILSDSGIPIGSFNITYVNSMTIANIVPLYYTSKWSGAVASSKDCPGAGQCPTSGCPATFPVNYLSGPATLWPGVKQCEASCACAGCGCFRCNDACLFWEYGHVPVANTLHRVYKITSTTVQPTVKFEIELNGRSYNQSITIQPYPTTLLANYSAMVIGSYSGEQTNFGTDKLVINSAAAKLIYANDYNVALYGSIGDIQSTSSSAFTTPSTSAFIIPSAVVPHISSQDSVTFSFPSSGTNLFTTRPSLPTTIGATLWSYDGTRLVGLNTNPGGVQIAFSTLAPISLQFDVTAVCPIADPVISTTGCYNCPSGFSISINAHSSCDTGTAQVVLRTNNRIVLFTPSVLLGPVSNRYILSLSSLDRSISGNIDLVYGENIATFTFSTVLLDPPPLTQQQLDYVRSNVSDLIGSTSTDSFSDWWGSLTGTAAIVKWVGSIISGLVTLAIIIGILVGLFYLGSYLYNRRMDNVNYQIPSEDVHPSVSRFNDFRNSLSERLRELQQD